MFKPCFNLIKSLFMINSNKNAFLVLIYNIFGCAFEKRMLLPYTLFISSLCFDSSLQGSPDDILLLSIINELKTKPTIDN